MSGTIVAAAGGTDITLSGGHIAYVVVVAIIALAAVGMAMMFRREVLAFSEGTENMKTISVAVQEGAAAYLSRQFRTLGGFVILVFLLLFLLPGDANIRIGRSIFFVIGALCVATAAYGGERTPELETIGARQADVASP